MIKPDMTLALPDTIGSVHFVGVGGSGMSGIAHLFLDAGHRVSGSDLRESYTLGSLRERGARISVGHDAANIGDADTVVVTSALWPENPELVAARERGITVIHRSQALAWLANRSNVVAVAGAHGKTTSTGMIVTALTTLGTDPSFVNGGVIKALGRSSGTGEGGVFVLEADESDGSFLLYDAAIALVTNVDPDHIDHYGSKEAVEDAFVEFAGAASNLVVISSDDEGAKRVTASLIGQRIMTFGRHRDADVRVVDIDDDPEVGFAVHYQGVRYATRLRIPGAHNAVNAAGAFAVLIGLGVQPRPALDAIAGFGGTGRRFDLHATIGGVSVYDDYAHHPTEVDAALTAARTVVGDGRIIAVHQPHLYSRTQLMAGEFAEVLERTADLTVVLDICGAREDPVPGVTGALVSDRFSDQDRVVYIADWQRAADYVGQIARPGDFVITLGCGDVNLLVPQLLGALEVRGSAAG